MLALVLALAAATPFQTTSVAHTTSRVDDDDDGDGDDGDDGIRKAPGVDTPMWGPIENDEDDEDDDDLPHLADEAPSREANAGRTGRRAEARLPFVDALGVMATAAAVPLVVGPAAGVASLLLAVAIVPQAGYGILLIVGAAAAVGALVGTVAGAELGVALFGDTRDHAWVSLGAPTGAVIALVLALSILRTGLRVEPLSTLGGSFVLGSAAGTGVVLVARHADLPEAPVVSGLLLGVGSVALGVGAAVSVLGPVSNDSRAGLDEAVAPTVMVLGAATLVAALACAPRDRPRGASE